MALHTLNDMVQAHAGGICLQLLRQGTDTHSILRKPHATHSCVLAYGRDAADVAFISDYGTAPLEVGAMTVQVTAA